MDREQQLRNWAKKIAQEVFKEGGQFWMLKDRVEFHTEIPLFDKEAVLKMAQQEWKLL